MITFGTRLRNNTNFIDEKKFAYVKTKKKYRIFKDQTLSIKREK